jgi:hypothetical protein
MKWISLCAALPVAFSVWTNPVRAESTERPSHIPTQQKSDGPFGTQWAKPPGTTGSHIYNDPRRRDPNSPYKTQRSRPCPAPTLPDTASGGCR